MSDDCEIRTLLVDDHPLVLEGVQSCIDGAEGIVIVGTARSGEEAIAEAERLRPDVVVMDINMPGVNGLDATEIIRERVPETKLLILSMHDKREYVETALVYGARGYVLKDRPTAEIVAAIHAVHSGGVYFSAGVSEHLTSDPERSQSKRTLTTREQAVLLLLAEGKSNKEAARALDISVRTVETHRKNIKRKTGLSSTAGLTRYAIENGILTL
jgi:DNA-binding NarL/FixJ family response regulator